MSQPSVILATAMKPMITRIDSGKPKLVDVTVLFSILIRLEITPDKRYLAAACNPHIRVNSNNPQPVITYDSHTKSVGFQCDGKWMYSGSEDGTLKIWDLRMNWKQNLKN